MLVLVLWVSVWIETRWIGIHIHIRIRVRVRVRVGLGLQIGFEPEIQSDSNPIAHFAYNSRAQNSESNVQVLFYQKASSISIASFSGHAHLGLSISLLFPR